MNSIGLLLNEMSELSISNMSAFKQQTSLVEITWKSHENLKFLYTFRAKHLQNISKRFKFQNV